MWKFKYNKNTIKKFVQIDLLISIILKILNKKILKNLKKELFSLNMIQQRKI